MIKTQISSFLMISNLYKKSDFPPEAAFFMQNTEGSPKPTNA
jgi:hypothetical protein